MDYFYPMEKLINTIRHERTKRGTTLAVMAEHCGMTPQMLSKIERHEQEPGVVNAMRISLYLNISVEGLFKFVEDEKL